MTSSDDAEANVETSALAQFGRISACGGDAEAHAAHHEGKRARKPDNPRSHAALRCFLSSCYQTQPFRSALSMPPKRLDSMLGL